MMLKQQLTQEEVVHSPWSTMLKQQLTQEEAVHSLWLVETTIHIKKLLHSPQQSHLEPKLTIAAV
jgi:hypothetical protein